MKGFGGHVYIEFDSDLFFVVILPPIIFAGGFCISKHRFF